MLVKGDKVKLTVEIPRDLWRRARVKAAETDTDLRTVVIRALDEHLGPRVPKKAADRR